MATRDTVPDQLPADIHPITIDLSQKNAINELALPARPGDTLIVPAAGEVTVAGWVQNPGAYKITPGMTALGAVSAAGGALFSMSAQILRTSDHNQRQSIPINLRQVQKGYEPDIPVRSGDVVLVDRSVLGAIPYALYEVFTKFGTGLYLPTP
jgi:protein involved in polysaccharide export with SLBB domain